MLPHPIAQLDAFCTAHPVRPKVLFAPNEQVGRNLTTAWARRGAGGLHLRVTTPAAWAERHVAPRLQAAGWTRLANGAGRFLLRDALDQLGARASLEPLPKGTGTLLRAIRDLRAAGLTPTALRRAALPPAKREALARVLDAYETRLEAAQLYDAETLFRAGAAHAAPTEAVYAILDATRLSRGALRFVRAVAGNQLVRIGQPQAHGEAVDPPPDSAACRCAEASHPAASGTSHPAASLWTTGLTPDDRAAVRVRTALGVGAEVRGVLRDVLDRGLPLDQVEIVYTAEAPYLNALWAAAERFDVPMTLATGRPVRSTPAGQALRGFFRWVAQGCDTARLAALCRARLLTFDRAVDPPPAPPDVAAVLDRGVHGPGCHRHRDLIARLEDRCGEDDDAEREQLLRARTALEALVALVPDDEAAASTRDLALAGVTFLTDFGPGDPEAASVTSLIERLRDVADAVGTVTGARSHLASMLQRLVETHTVEASAARPGALHGAPLERAGYTGRPHSYVVGLDEAAFPAPPPSDPVLLDTERAALDGLTPLVERSGDAEWHLARVLGAVSETVTLSARTYSLTEGAPVFPAPRFQRAARQLGYREDAAGAAPVPSFGLVPAPGDVPLDATERLLAARHGDDFEAAVRDGAPWLVQGQHAQARRAADPLTRFDGLTGRPAPNHALGDGATSVSASRLETLAACPFRYFLKRVLEVEPPQTPEEDPTRWLDPLQFGQLLHDLYQTFMERLDGDVTSQAAHEETLMALLEQHIAAYRAQTPVQHEAAFQADRRRLERAARVFLAAEARRSDAEPVAFEVSFGQGVSVRPHRPSPVTVPLTDAVQLRLEGRIDRVDRLPNGDYAIWDYKTGSMYGYDEQDLGAAGQRLQWALYAYAFEEMLAAADAAGTVARSGYFFANGRAYGQRLAASPPPRDALGAQLEPLLDLAAQGAFPHVQKRRGACTFCHYRRICADESKTARDTAKIIDATADEAVCDALARWMQSD